ncbi:glycosyltransferase family 4 protein [Dissulfurirhabdus thermomarina]|uniref:Glycosyltransferase family 4 protein n=1 Tax=Dissulfurirhabdus thermomarina TaxID=1765737 RepID=A0A6N9TPC7_DISTH|nr:glycosyltransferase family 4 protein [Dissulfurirhabdus thermomarina]NDY42300.1 glycosyltransferase family 4 protein [Dissulfurirhabdus thermomarina]NMX24159.1 glycosyltransferase family 4 protein [Dissulfurirhabdus thermomarina]
MKLWLPTLRTGSGADVFVERLAPALMRLGVDVEVSWFDHLFEQAPFLLSRVAPPKNTDIVLANSWNAFAFKRPGIPLVVVEHHCVLDPALRPYKNLAQHIYHTALIRRFEAASFRAADRVVAVSEYTASSLRQAFGLGGVLAIPLWLPTERFTPREDVSADHSARTEERPFRLLFVGNLIRRKGADLLAPIMAELGDDFQLRFTAGLRSSNKGTWPKNMVPLGRLSEAELLREYRGCDALLFPTRFEGFGYVALEAMACGKPVVASDNTAIPELVVDGATGILCPTGDVGAFVEACRRLAVDRDLCRAMGERGRVRAVSEFSEERNATRYLAVLKEVLAGRDDG